MSPTELSSAKRRSRAAFFLERGDALFLHRHGANVLADAPRDVARGRGAAPHLSSSLRASVASRPHSASARRASASAASPPSPPPPPPPPRARHRLAAQGHQPLRQKLHLRDALLPVLRGDVQQRPLLRHDSPAASRCPRRSTPPRGSRRARRARRSQRRRQTRCRFRRSAFRRSAFGLTRDALRSPAPAAAASRDSSVRSRRSSAFWIASSASARAAPASATASCLRRRRRAARRAPSRAPPPPRAPRRRRRAPPRRARAPPPRFPCRERRDARGHVRVQRAELGRDAVHFPRALLPERSPPRSASDAFASAKSVSASLAARQRLPRGARTRLRARGSRRRGRAARARATLCPPLCRVPPSRSPRARPAAAGRPHHRRRGFAARRRARAQPPPGAGAALRSATARSRARTAFSRRSRFAATTRLAARVSEAADAAESASAATAMVVAARASRDALAVKSAWPARTRAPPREPPWRSPRLAARDARGSLDHLRGCAQGHGRATGAGSTNVGAAGVSAERRAAFPAETLGADATEPVASGTGAPGRLMKSPNSISGGGSALAGAGGAPALSSMRLPCLPV